MILRTLPLVFAWLFGMHCCIHAQDPFGGLGDAATAPDNRTNPSNKGAGKSEEVDVKERDAVVLSLRREPPQDAMGIAKAVQWMARIRRWDEAGRWLDKLGAMDIDPATALRIVEAVGSSTILDVENKTDRLDASQRAVVTRIRQLAAQALTDPKSLGARVQQLRSPNRGDRLAAFDAIKSSGTPGITAMLNAMLAENAEAPNTSMVEAFSLLGDHATRAWQVAMTTPHDDARARLVALVARVAKPNMGCELMAELCDPGVGDAVKQSVQQMLAPPNAPLPTAERVQQNALQWVEHSLAEYQRRRQLDEVDTETMWSLQEGGRSIAETPAVQAQLYLARASQAAQIALRLIPQSDLASATAVAAHWEFWSAQGHEDISQDRVFQEWVPEDLRDSYEFACLIWDAAVKYRLSGAQAMAVGNLGRWEGAAIPGPVRDRLVAATRSGHPMVRFPATVSLMKSILEMASAADAKPSSGASSWAGFTGSSRIDSVGREMQQLSNDPCVLIIGGNEGLRGHLHGLLDQFGYRYFEAPSAAQVFQLLRSDLPVEGVFIVEHLRDLDLGQLIQRLRANVSTSAVPIALLADSLSRGEHEVAENDHRVVMSSVPPSLEGLGDIIRRMQGVTDLPRLSTESRILLKESADNYFQSIKPSLLPSLQGGRDAILAASREDQQNLLRIIGDSTQGALKREQASQIFVQSVRRFGLLISSETARDQYDVYNARGESEPVTRAVLGRVLDAIEASHGQRAWSEISP